MDSKRKSAYLDMLSHGFAAVRDLPRMNPEVAQENADKINELRYLSDWLQSLAEYASHDFMGFNEKVFWHDCKAIEADHPELVTPFRERFEESVGEI